MKTKKTLELLRAYESRNVTFVELDGSWPIVWERARGVHVWDAEGRKYLDLTAAFGVAAAGHANPNVVKAGQRQMTKLLHAMGDVHPHELKARLARELSKITFERWNAADVAANMNSRHSLSRSKNNQRRFTSAATGKVIFCNSGFEAVEAALKTALLATGKRGVISFSGAYHGLGYGALNATHRDHFRTSFRSQLRQFCCFAPFPAEKKNLVEVESVIRSCFRRHKIGAILVEPIQARGGINIPPPQFLPLLRNLCDEHEALLILDEIYTGFGRTGKWFACEHTKTFPDVICLGKALTGGFPLSACVGRADVMDEAWPPSSGEAIHTSTFLGHPVGCAMALAQIAEIRELKLVEQSASMGKRLLKLLSDVAADVGRRKSTGKKLARTNVHGYELELAPRGVGLMAGLELKTKNGSPARKASLQIIKAMLHRGFILLPEGEHANVISFTPPLTITERDLKRTVEKLKLVFDSL